MKFRGFFSAALMVFAAGAAQAQIQPQIQTQGALGIPPGTPLERLTVLEKRINGQYVIRPPLTHPDGDEYRVIAAPGTGVCVVILFSKEFDQDPSGFATQNIFSKFKSQLETKYGSPTDAYYWMRPGSLWSGPNSWVTAIKQEDRQHIQYWLDAGALAPYGISSIRLGVVAYSPASSSAYVKYEYANFDRCQQELKAVGGSVL